MLPAEDARRLLRDVRSSGPHPLKPENGEWHLGPLYALDLHHSDAHGRVHQGRICIRGRSDPRGHGEDRAVLVIQFHFNAAPRVRVLPVDEEHAVITGMYQSNVRVSLQSMSLDGCMALPKNSEASITLNGPHFEGACGVAHRGVAVLKHGVHL